MSGLPWIPLYVDFPSSRKAIALGVALQRPLAWAYVVRLWTEAAKNAADGSVDGPAAVQIIEKWAAWDGEPGELVDAMVLPHIALLDHTSGGFYIHDWSEHCGAHVAKLEKERQRKRNARAAAKPKTVRGQGADSPPMSADKIEREREIENKEALALPASIKPLGVHLQAQCPKLCSLVAGMSDGGTQVEVGRIAAKWDEAEALIAAIGEDVALDACLEAASRRKGEGSVPLAYLLYPLRDRAAIPRIPRPKPAAVEPDPDPGCPEWGTAREKVRGQIRPDLWRWFRPLRGRVAGGELVLVAPDAFHANFTRDTYGSFLTEQAGMPVRIEAAQ